MTDAQLVAQALAGDARAFGALVTRYRDLAVSVAYAATGDVGLAEDLAQEAFVVAWRRLSALAHRDRFGPWLCGIVRHVGRSERRHRGRHAPGGSPEPLSAIEAPVPSPLDEAMARQALARTWAALRALPPRYREPLVLFCRFDHSHARVAESLGLTEETVRQRISRARQKLRAEVDGVERQVRAARAPAAAGVIALIWTRSARAGAPVGSGWLVGIAAPIAAVCAALVLAAAGLTAARALSPVASAAEPPARSDSRARVSSREVAPADMPIARPSVEMGRGAIAPAAPPARAVARTSGVRHGRIVKHGPAVVVPRSERSPRDSETRSNRMTPRAPDAPRPLLRPSADIDPTAFLP